jgi:hypothetical protein
MTRQDHAFIGSVTKEVFMAAATFIYDAAEVAQAGAKRELLGRYPLVRVVSLEINGAAHTSGDDFSVQSGDGHRVFD